MCRQHSFNRSPKKVQIIAKNYNFLNVGKLPIQFMRAYNSPDRVQITAIWLALPIKFYLAIPNKSTILHIHTFPSKCDKCFL